MLSDGQVLYSIRPIVDTNLSMSESKIKLYNHVISKN